MPIIGEMQLVRTNEMIGNEPVYDVYVYGGNLIGWEYKGKSNEKDAIEDSLSNTLQAIPEGLGQPGQSLTVSADGTALIWQNPPTVEDEDGYKTRTHPQPWKINPNPSEGS